MLPTFARRRELSVLHCGRFPHNPPYVGLIIRKYGVNIWAGFFWLRMSPLAILMDLWAPKKQGFDKFFKKRSLLCSYRKGEVIPGFN
jgi:hypothetical protein